jgi:hypothetical protein
MSTGVAQASVGLPPDSGCLTDPNREEFRARMVAQVPTWYSPWAHLCCTTGLGASVVAVSIAHLRDLKLLELLIVPAVFVISNCVEWHAHKNLLHRRTPPVHALYDRHTPEHHRVYRRDDMALRSWRELRLVLIPAVGVLTIIVTMLPGAALSAALFGANSGWLFLLTSSAYVVGYELTHLLYHLPAQHPLSRLGIVRVLRSQHATHHDPSLMQRWNFNVTVPLADWMFGTWVRPPRGQA